MPRERARALGVFGAIAGAGGAAGLLLGGVLTEDLSWRWNLYVNVVIAAIAVIGAVVFVDSIRPAGPRPKVDIPGTVLVPLPLPVPGLNPLTIERVGSQRCIDIHNGDTATAGRDLVIFDCTGQPSQSWVAEQATDRQVLLRSALRPDLCMDNNDPR